MVVYQIVILLLLLGAALLLLWNLGAFLTVRRSSQLPPGMTEENAPLISVLVPARNEERRIRACAGSLLAQTYPNYEVLVLDDHSEDRTRQILEELGYVEAPGARFRILTGRPLPGGWTGKSWACHQLAQAAKGEYLLFLDADTTHVPEMLTSALTLALETRADLFSAWPRPVTKTWSEKLVISVITLTLASYPHARWQQIQSSPERAKKEKFRRWYGGANGQFLMFKRSSYEAIGGHAAVRNHLVEDVALGREVAERAGEGMRLINCSGVTVSEVRMYNCFAEVWEGFTKNARAVFENSLFFYFFTGFWYLFLYLLPFVLVWFLSGTAFWLGVAQIGVIYFMRAVLTVRFRQSWMGALLHPFGVLLGMIIALNSWRCSATKGVTWKGRRYEVVHPQQGAN